MSNNNVIWSPERSPFDTEWKEGSQYLVKVKHDEANPDTCACMIEITGTLVMPSLVFSSMPQVVLRRDASGLVSNAVIDVDSIDHVRTLISEEAAAIAIIEDFEQQHGRPMSTEERVIVAMTLGVPIPGIPEQIAELLNGIGKEFDEAAAAVASLDLSQVEIENGIDALSAWLANPDE